MTLLRPLLTPWGEALDADHPLPEYPRPQLVRDSYLNLNGRWQYAITTTPQPPARYDGEIVVPYSPEAPLSGVRRQLMPDQVLHYRRTFGLPDGFRPNGDDRVLLHFGAVDQTCRVSVNGEPAGQHAGGYLPFRLDVTDLLHDGDNALTVAVSDPSDAGPLSRGKQRLRRGGIWYTAQSGIWQTVWLEAVPATWIERLVVTPDLPGAAVTVVVGAATAGPGSVDGTPAATEITCRVTVLADGRQVGQASGVPGEPLRIAVPDPRPWSPGDPYLYDLVVTCGADRVTSYVGLRSLGIGTDGSGRRRFLLNGRPYFAAGVLDQGYWPDGLYTPASDVAMAFDIATAKQLGFTMIRKHIKVEPLRWYAHCDRIGMLVWQDFVNGGGPYRVPVVSGPAVVPLHLSDRRHAWFGRADAAAREHWLGEADATVELLRNSPAVVAWVPFNEGWGQFDAAAVAQRIHALDPTRPVDHASGWHDQGAGDIDSRHVYLRPFRVGRRRKDPRVLALTEYGGYSLRLPEHSASADEFGYRRFGSASVLRRALRRLHERQVVPAIDAGLSATVYTQLADVEDETNGLLTADRRMLKIPASDLRDVFSRLRLPTAAR